MKFLKMSLVKNIKMLQSWKKTKNHLRNALKLIKSEKFNEDQLEIFRKFQEYIDHNEFELAFDELELLTKAVNVPKEFWQEIYLAVKQMEEHAERCEPNQLTNEQKLSENLRFHA